MSGQVYIERMIFQRIDKVGNVLETSYGIRLYDHDNSITGHEIGTIDRLRALSDEMLVLEAWKLGGHAAAMVEAVKESGKPIMIDGRDVFLGEIAPPSCDD